MRRQNRRVFAEVQLLSRRDNLRVTAVIAGITDIGIVEIVVGIVVVIVRINVVIITGIVSALHVLLVELMIVGKLLKQLMLIL